MIDIVKELKSGNVGIFDRLTQGDKEYTISLIKESIKKNEILNKILPILRENDNWYNIEFSIFKLIYLESEYKEYTFYLLHKEYVKPEDLTSIEFTNMLNNTTWGIDYIYDNLERIVNSSNVYQLMEILVKFCKKDINIYKKFLQKILKIPNQEIRDKFIENSLFRKIPIDINEIISSIYKKPDDFIYKQETLPFYNEKIELNKSELPSSLIFYSNRDNNLKQMIIENFLLFFESEKKEKMNLLNNYKISDETNSKLIEKYLGLIDLYLSHPSTTIDHIVSTIINSEYSLVVEKMLENERLEYLDSGSTTHVFKIGDKVLKFTEKKYEVNTEKDFFLIAPTETIILYNEDGIVDLIIEKQNYLDKVYDNTQITDQDVENFMTELDKLGYIITDPHCVSGEYDNFGFLKDYHDAQLGDLKSHEELPEWFKKRPIVLYDIDLVYKKDKTKIKTFPYMGI